MAGPANDQKAPSALQMHLHGLPHFFANGQSGALGHKQTLSEIIILFIYSNIIRFNIKLQ